MKHFELSFKDDFSWDVVLVLEDLAKAFNIRQDDWDTLVSCVEERLGIGTRKEIFKRYIIFNEREQELDIVYGITVGDLRDVLADNDISESRRENTMGHLRNAFSMLDPHGNMPQPIHFHIFKGEFTPQFYPMRYALKDSIYSQRLDVLAYLLFYNLKRYSKMPTSLEYVEFSVGVRDICRPWVFDVLTSFENQNEHFRGKFSSFHHYFPWMSSSKENMVQHKYLAGFGRGNTDITAQYQRGGEYLLLEEPSFAISLAMDEINYSKESQPSALFGVLEDDLEVLDKRFKGSLKNVLHHWVVGLDWFGDEKGYPFCAFVTNKFVTFVKTRREKNPRFGIRIHCAENIPTIKSTSNAYRMLSAHMYVTYLCLKYLNFILCKTENSYPIRIGHGVGFINLLTEEEEISNSSLSVDIRKSSILINAIKNDRDLFKNFLFEINLTSNSFLLYDKLQSNKKIDFPFILCTDDDGIWPIDNCKKGHNGHFSLTAEYCNAIYDDYIKDETALNSIIKNAEYGRFFLDEVDSTQVRYKELSGFELETVLPQRKFCEISENFMKVAEYARICCKSDSASADSDSASADSDWKEAVKSVIKTAFKTNSGVYVVIQTSDSTVFYTSESPSSVNFLEKTVEFLMTQYPDNKYLKKEYPDNEYLNILKVVAFCGYFDSESIASYCKKLPDQIEIKCFSNSYKHKYFSDIPSNVSINSAPMGRDSNSYFYCICTHGSMVTAALHFIANNMNDKKLVVLEHNLPTIENLIVPFAKQRYEYYNGADAFFKDYNLPKSPSKFKIESSEFKVARWIKDSKINERLKKILEENKSSSWKHIWQFIDKLKDENKKETIKSIVLCFADYKLLATEFCILRFTKEPPRVEDALVPIICEKNEGLCCKKVTNANEYSDPLLYFLETVLDIKRNSSSHNVDSSLWEHASLVFQYLKEEKSISSIELMAFVKFSDKVAHSYRTTKVWCRVFEYLIGEVGIKKLNSEEIKVCLNVLKNKTPYKLGNAWQKNSLTDKTKGVIKKLEDENKKKLKNKKRKLA